MKPSGSTCEWLTCMRIFICTAQTFEDHSSLSLTQYHTIYLSRIKLYISPELVLNDLVLFPWKTGARDPLLLTQLHSFDWPSARSQPRHEKFGAAQGHWLLTTPSQVISWIAPRHPFTFSKSTHLGFFSTLNDSQRAYLEIINRVIRYTNTPNIVHRDARPLWLNRILARASLRTLYVMHTRNDVMASQHPSDSPLDATRPSDLFISIPCDASTWPKWGC